MTELLWALWIVSGGYAYSSGGLWQAQPVAYFATQQGCDKANTEVAKLLGEHSRPMQCIQADYRSVPK